jgi:hypothetical protein
MAKQNEEEEVERAQPKKWSRQNRKGKRQEKKSLRVGCEAAVRRSGLV